MGLINKLSNKILGNDKNKRADEAIKNATLRRCRFEVMEERKVLSADPVIAGVTYLEGDAGQDITPDHFEVTFQGGAETTELTQFVINGDQDLNGVLSDGDVFFDNDGSLPGTGGFHEFQFDAANSSGVTADDVQSFSVSEDGLTLTVDVDNFTAGDVFAFTIDVDEVEGVRNDRIASGVEFESSQFTATFVDENFNFEGLNVTADEELEGGFIQAQQEGIFYDEYNTLFAEAESLVGAAIDLERDNETGQADRTAGAIDAYELVEKPISISGTVFHDDDLDCIHDGSEGEEGLSNIPIELQLLNEETGQYETVASTVTDANGNYEFGTDLGLLPGTYQLVQEQPDGYIDVGAVAGSEGGDVLDDASGNGNIISNIEITLGGTESTGNNFKEIEPASIHGNVFHDENDNGIFDPGEEGIADVLIQVTRVGAKDGVSNDPFADMEPVFVTTDENGAYWVDSLPPGIYEVVEINNYPPGQDPLADFIDGQDSTGNVNGVTNGVAGNDQFTQIELCPGEHGEEYNFGELQAASISGYVSVATPGEAKLSPDDPDFEPIAGVTIQLFDENNELVAETVTDETGNYTFDALAPGTYSVVEVQPNAFLDAGDVVGTVDGQAVGTTTTNDRFDGITVGSGDEAVNYNFCEHEPASIKGTVYHDRNNNGIQDEGEEGIAGVVIELFDKDGNLIQTATTDENGDYCFDDLPPGDYLLREQQPDGFDDGIDTVGQVDGVAGEHNNNDEFCITLGPGDESNQNNFGELILAEISGFVHINNDGDCDFLTTPPDAPIAGTTLELLDADGNVIATTVTDENGAYSFDGLVPGTYSVRQIQPTDFFTGGENVGDGDGTASTNLISNIVVESGQNVTQYNFCEHEAAEIHGRVFEDGPAFETEDGQLPEGFRDQRDSVFQEGVDTPIAGVRVELYYFIDPTAGPEGEIAPRPVTISEVLPEFYDNIDASDPDAPVFVETDANGEYWFQGLQAGSYVVLEVQPDGFEDANDVPGTTTGFTFNNEGDTETAIAPLTSVFSDVQLMDSVVGISVDNGGVSLQNNFTEVSVTLLPPPPTPETPETITPAIPVTPSIPGNPVTPRPGVTGIGGLGGSEPSAFTTFIGTSRGASFQTQANATGGGEEYTWHLSVVNGGLPRATGGDGNDDSVWQQVGFIGSDEWDRFEMEEAVWTFTEMSEDFEITRKSETSIFGMIGGTPLAGDFDGDGSDEIAVFNDGYWLIDINHNGRWDQDDLLAKLGDAEDRPVVGDWDGDGKDDIGIFGPIWEKDREAIEQDPGLPNPANSPFTRAKNVPPADSDATNGARVMKLTSYGEQRSDVVDHVFGVEDGGITPVTGDWNGNGIRSIGKFQDGRWDIDVNGDGRFGGADASFNFGTTGDIPLVGDFNGDGVEEIAVYRSGTWLIDTNGNRELDATDKTFEMGGADDKPVVGDFNGDGIDEPAIYSPRPASDIQL